MRSVLGVVLLSVLAAGGAVAAEDYAARYGHIGPEGYRMEAYRAPTPQSVPGGTVVDLEALRRLLAEPGTVVLDVRQAPTGPDGRLLASEPLEVIPGGRWLPGIGLGAVEPDDDARYREILADLTGGDRERPVVFYCKTDCWMSWNATIRAAGYGYRRLYWYPDGIDGWLEAGGDTDRAWPIGHEQGG